ncbi:dimethyl sulfoxide reductase anchor subunit family protein [Thiohalomonas denitrificans]|uniref:dimethyl sulfoxide reductase anchor subunit family protein n=1 Tax=Thiohalomonas denitrificans TaxID=415747 RepID=UPI0026EC4E6C|nr:DmsC/YnfH family molybdoenzyme membrane anchor subunit [Thiohalomonas denitrificans]
MHPAFSVIFLTTFIGVGQGLFLALFTLQSYSALELLPVQDSREFFAAGSFLALLFLVAGLGASVFHLGKPSFVITRAWRAASQWRTSWLSREIVFIPAVIALVFLYGLLHYLGWEANLFDVDIAGQLTLVIGTVTTLFVFALFVSTAMIYAAIKFLQEWASPLTVLNYTLLGIASGFTLATAFAAWEAPILVNFFGGWAILFTLAALGTRTASLIRNARIKHKSTLQTAIGVRHSHIEQKAMGMMGGSFNTREYFHGKTAAFLKSVKWIFLVLVFAIPLVLLAIGIGTDSLGLLAGAFVSQYLGLLFERWYFFAQANHPQNLYYQTI